MILSNIYLHYLLDLWLFKVVTPRMRGSLVRFGRFSREGVAKFNEGKQKSITFLGFDFIPVSHLNGKFRVQMQTNRHRLNRFLQGIKFSIRKNQHHAIND